MCEFSKNKNKQIKMSDMNSFLETTLNYNTFRYLYLKSVYYLSKWRIFSHILAF